MRQLTFDLFWFDRRKFISPWGRESPSSQSWWEFVEESRATWRNTFPIGKLQLATSGEMLNFQSSSFSFSERPQLTSVMSFGFGLVLTYMSSGLLHCPTEMLFVYTLVFFTQGWAQITEFLNCLKLIKRCFFFSVILQLKLQSTAEDAELVSVLGGLGEKFRSTLKSLETFQSKNSEFVFNTGWSFYVS